MIFGLSNLAVYAVAAGVLFAAGFTSAWKVQNWRFDAQKAEQLAEEKRMYARRETITVNAGTKFEAARAKIVTVTKTQIKEVVKYVPVSDCPMSPGFRVFHDAAASGKVPEPSSIADAAAVTAQEVATTVADNYGSCREDGARLEALQQWVKQQVGENPDAGKSP